MFGGKPPADPPMTPEALEALKAAADGPVGDLPLGTSPSNADTPRLPPGFERIREHVFSIDEFAEYEAAIEELKIGDEHTADGIVKEQLDRAEHRALRAHRLYVNALIAVKAYRIDMDIVHGSLWDEATADLQREKDAGTRKKAITNDDVRYRCAQLFPDQWRATNSELEEAEQLVKHLGVLSDVWMSRCASLRNLRDNR